MVMTYFMQNLLIYMVDVQKNSSLAKFHVSAQFGSRSVKILNVLENILKIGNVFKNLQDIVIHQIIQEAFAVQVLRPETWLTVDAATQVNFHSASNNR